MPPNVESVHAGVLMTHVVATGMMTGVIWFVQIVHYPLLAAVGAESFASYHDGHVRRTGRVVGPLMLIELASALGLVAMASGTERGLAVAGAGLLAAIWASTFLVQVPCHDALARGYDAAAWRRLTRTNWFRTALWTTRTAVAIALFQYAA